MENLESKPNAPPDIPSAVDIRQHNQKESLLQQLKKTPIVQVACEKVNISRATYYRWHKDDQEFAEAADEALAEGSGLVNDMAESQLMSAIKNGNLTAVIFWLKNHHKNYAATLQVKHAIQDENLTPEQEALVREALRLAAISQPEIINIENDNEQPNDNDNTKQSDSTGISGSNDQGQESPNSDN